MNEASRNGGSPRPAGFTGSFSPTSLFGGAILATVATASLAQVTYFATASALKLGTVASGYVALGGNLAQGDGGGGTFVPGPAGCAGDGGLVFPDAVSNCFYRTNPTNSVREWGALCDVTSTTGASWDGVGTLTIPGSTMSPQTAPVMGENIVISQIGAPTLWGSSTPAVSMTRFSTLSNQGSNYAPGDLISFAGGTFSQQAAIIVDSVKSVIAGSATIQGVIDQWHFLWGGLYNATLTPTGTMAQDNSHTFCGDVTSGGTITYTACGTTVAVGAAMAPAWSGWSVLDRQSVYSGGTQYAVGEIVTLTATGSTVNGTHFPTLIVENVDTISGAVLAYDWLDYGSFSSLSIPSSLNQTHSSGLGTGLTFSPVAWTQAPFATTITNSPTLSSGAYAVTLADTPPFPGPIAINYLYYGHDDFGAISKAIMAAPKGGLIVPAGCGTTKAINLSPPANSNPAQNFSTFLKGANLQSSGLYAFASPPSSRASSPILAHVIYSGVLNSSKNGFVAMPGGGFSNMFVLGLGLPEGYGYWGLFENSGMTSNAPAGYVGPTFTATGTIANVVTNNIPTAGNLVEIDASSQMRIDKVLISNGGIGSGNSNLQCGLDESDPAQIFVSGSIANITLTDSRVDTSTGGFGATNPDFVVRLGASCHDSVYTADLLYGGTKADVLVYGGNLFSRIHLNSGAANSSAPMKTAIPWPYSQTFGLAGNADYGFYIIGNTSVSETQCDIANRACVFALPASLGGSSNPGQITDTQMKCGSLRNTPPGYLGVELSAGTANTTVSGTAPSNQCAISPFQLVQLDGPVDFSTSLCENSSATVAGCTGYQGTLAAAQSYTQPTVAYSTGTVTSTGLFAIPFVSPAVGATVHQLGIRVLAPAGSATQCTLGIYNAAAQKPQSLVLIGRASPPGALLPGGTFTATGTVSITGSLPASFVATLPSPGAQLAPGTLYFLAATCNGTATLNGVTGPGGSLSPPLIGASNGTDTVSGIISSGWTGSTVLPNPFVNATFTSGAWAPNVYAQP